MKKIKRSAKRTMAFILMISVFLLGIPIQVMAASNEFVEPPPKSLSSISSVFTTVGDTQILTGEYDNVAMVTYDAKNQTGALWAADKLDLNLPFYTEMMLHLGHSKDGTGTLADGMTFTMHNDEERNFRALGGKGEGLGAYRGRVVSEDADIKDGYRIKNSLMIEFDSYYNIYYITDGFFISDPEEDALPQDNQRAHCAVVIPTEDRVMAKDHHNVFYFDVRQKWEKFTVSWEPLEKNGKLGGKLVYTFIDDTKRVFPIDDVETVFGGREVYWGFTGATGSYTSYQAAAITKLPTQEVIAVKDVLDSGGRSVNGKTVNVGDTLTYSIEVTASNISNAVGPITISDPLSTYVNYLNDGVRLTTSSTPSVVKTIPARIVGNELVVDTGEILQNPGDSIKIEFDVDVLEKSVGQVIKNVATIYGDNLSEPQKSNVTETTVNKVPYKIVDCMSESGARGKPVKPGDDLTLRIGYVNSGTSTSNLTITDSLAKSLSFVSCSDNGVYNAGEHKITWTIKDVKAGDFGNVKLNVKVNDYADGIIKNVANLAWEDGGTDKPEVEIPVKGSYKIVDVDSEAGVMGSPVTLNDIVTFKIGYLNPTGVTANLKITDIIPDGMEYYPSADGSTYNNTTKELEWNINSVLKEGFGYVKFKAKVISVNQPIIRNTGMLSWTHSGGEEIEKPFVELSVGSYKVVDYSSIAGTNGDAVSPGDLVTFRISYINSTGVVSNLTIKDKLPLGIKYISHTGTLSKPYNTVDRELEWRFTGIAPNEKGYVTVTVEVEENVGREILNKAVLEWENGDDEDPEITVPVKSYKIVSSNSEAGKEGTAVVPGDVITYKIGYVNNTGQLSSLTITDFLDKGVTYLDSSSPLHLSSDAENGVLVWKIDNLPNDAAGSFTVRVVVNEQIGKTLVNKAELAWEHGDEEKPEVTIPVGLYKVVDENSAAGQNGERVRPGDEIMFRIGYWNNSERFRNLVIYDTLDEGTDYVSSYFEDMETQGSYNSNTRTAIWDIGRVAPNSSGYVYLKVRVNANANSVIKNYANMKWDNENPTPGPEIEIPLGSYKLMNDSNVEGVASPVNVGDIVTCRIGFVNNTGVTSNLVITDELPMGVEYKGHGNGNVTGKYEIESSTSQNPEIVVWRLKNIPDKATGYVTVTFEVKETSGAIIKNIARLEWATETEEPEVEIPVKSKKYIKSGSGVNGTPVEVGNTIVYTINYINQTGEIADLTIKDVLPEGTIYVGHTAIGADKNNYDVVKKTVTWEYKNLMPTASGEVTLTIKIDKAVSKSIINIADMEWVSGGERKIEKPSAEVPLGTFTLTYDPNGGEGGTTKAGLVFDDVHKVYTASEANVKRSGYSFNGWKTEAEGGDSFKAGDGLVIKGNMTLYAQWKKNDGGGGGGDDEFYTVTYNANGGTGSHKDENLESGTQYEVRSLEDTKISRAGFVFENWNTDAGGEGTAYKEGSTISISEDITLYAIWSPATSLDTDNHFAYIVGYPEGTFKPESNITRAEVATIFFRLLTLESRNDMWYKTNSFSDTEKMAWYNNSVSTLTHGKILSGYPDGTFRPYDNITRAEFATIVVMLSAENASGEKGVTFNNISGHWAEKNIIRAVELGYVSGYGDGTFRPEQPIIRAEVTSLLNRVLIRHVESKKDMHEGMVEWPDNSPTKWYYYDVQEATNSHFYEKKEGTNNEIWTEIRPIPNWKGLEDPKQEFPFAPF